MVMIIMMEMMIRANSVGRFIACLASDECSINVSFYSAYIFIDKAMMLAFSLNLILSQFYFLRMQN